MVNGDIGTPNSTDARSVLARGRGNYSRDLMNTSSRVHLVVGISNIRMHLRQKPWKGIRTITEERKPIRQWQKSRRQKGENTASPFPSFVTLVIAPFPTKGSGPW